MTPVSDVRLRTLRLTGQVLVLAALLLGAALFLLHFFGSRSPARLVDKRILTRGGIHEHRVYLEYHDGDVPRLLARTVGRGEYDNFRYSGKFQVLFFSGYPWTARLEGDSGFLPLAVLFSSGLTLLLTARVIRSHLGQTDSRACPLPGPR